MRLYIHEHMLSHRWSLSTKFFHCRWPPNHAGNPFVSKFPSPVPWLFSLYWVKHELTHSLIGKPPTRKNKCMEQLSSEVPWPSSSQSENSFSFIWTETWWELHWTEKIPLLLKMPLTGGQFLTDAISKLQGPELLHGLRILTLVKEGNSLNCLFSLNVKLIV